MDRKRVLTVFWENQNMVLDRVMDRLDVEPVVFRDEDFERDGKTVEDFIRLMDSCDLTIFSRRSSNFGRELKAAMEPIFGNYRIISFGSDPSDWSQTTVDRDLAIRCYEYLQAGMDENMVRMFDAIEKGMGWKEGEPLPVVEVPWQGIVDVDGDEVYDSLDSYIDAKGIDTSKPFVGILASRSSYMGDGLVIERALCRDLIGLGANPLLTFAMSGPNDDGAVTRGETIRRYFTRDGEPVVDAMVKMFFGFIGSDKDGNPADPAAIRLISEMNVPIFQPVVLSSMSEEEWRESGGLTNDISWQVVFPEFEGIVEPMVIGSSVGFTREGDPEKVSFPERIRTFAKRVYNIAMLRRKPNSEKRVCIFLNNFPCQGVEANVGNASGLDSLESVADILKRLRDEGYRIDPPEDGRDLITRMLDAKALSEFRWTTPIEMKKHGGVIHEMDLDEYMEYYRTLSDWTQKDVIRVWGEPPGEAMTLDGKILITGVCFGNAVVAVQPKRGCYGTRCDGQVCKILHDPTCPPTHQFLATYHYYEDTWGADMVMHTGTHGSMEWTPGKGVGMTESCYPDISIRDVPHFYIYNSDNPAEGLVAKRRSYATLVDHMQNLMVGVNLYGPYAELDGLLGEYAMARNNPSQADELRRKIVSKAREANMGDLGLTEETPLHDCVRLCHEALSRMRNSQANRGMHVFGTMPSGDNRTEAVNSIVRYGPEHDSLRDCIADLLGLDLSELYRDQGAFDERLNKSYGELIQDIGRYTRDFTGYILAGQDVPGALRSAGLDPDGAYLKKFPKFVDMIHEVDRRIEDSKELDSLVDAYNGGFVDPGPSGYITRGRYDIMPTGRNFYSMDPQSIPTRAAWEVGMKMVDATVEKHIQDEGRYPESVAFFWTMSQLISTGGETMSQMMYLMGTRPVWQADGRVTEYEIIPLEELGRPRIDIAVNLSCIMRDNMMSAADFVDGIVAKVAALDEPEDMNYVRKHSMDSVRDGMTEDEANARLFGAPPGTYVSGVNLAVFASAWKEDKDLADIFVRMKGHGYGGGRNGRPMQRQLATVLSKNDIVSEHTASDEKDVLTCSCHYSNVGGLVVASRYLSGRDVKAYYGDTRDPRDIGVGTMAEEFRRVMRIKVLNPEWIASMKEHGYKGAQEFMKRVTRLYGWQATTHEVDGWLFDEVVETYLKDRENLDFMRENNPYALEEMARRLLEANSRGLWDTDEETLGVLKDVYLDIESDLEELAGEGEFQGGSIDIYDSKSVEGWNETMSGLSDMTESIRGRSVKG